MSDTEKIPGGPDAHTQAAIDAEQGMLNDAIQRAQTEHLFQRVITLAAEVNRLTADLKTRAETEGSDFDG